MREDLSKIFTKEEFTPIHEVFIENNIVNPRTKKVLTRQGLIKYIKGRTKVENPLFEKGINIYLKQKLLKKLKREFFIKQQSI